LLCGKAENLHSGHAQAQEIVERRNTKEGISRKMPGPHDAEMENTASAPHPERLTGVRANYEEIGRTASIDQG
jgi:hypothetical protein